jgi:hypothetical protein
LSALEDISELKEKLLTLTPKVEMVFLRFLILVLLEEEDVDEIRGTTTIFIYYLKILNYFQKII